jgi:MFS family permease
MSFGVFQDFYSRKAEFKSDADNIAVIGTVATSLQFLGAPLITPLAKKYQRWQPHLVAIGSGLCILSLIAASFVNSVAGLIATQGVLYGLAFTILYMPMICMLNEWFVRRRGLAYGVVYAGGGVSGVGLPFLFEKLLSSYGHQTTLRAVAVAQFILVAPILPFLKGRLPPSPSNQTAIQRIDFAFFKHPLFWIFSFSNLCYGLAYYIPPLFLPVYASSMGFSSTVGALVLAASNLASVFGQVSLGYLTDHFQNIYILIFISSFTSSVAAFTIWGFSHSLSSLLAFSVIYGWAAGGYVVFWPKFGSILSDDPQPVYTLMAFGKGVGNVLTGPISAGLLARSVQSGSYGLSKFEPAVLFVGSLMLCSSLGVVGWPVKKLLPPTLRH